MLATTDAYLLLGTNMGNRVAQLSRARSEIAKAIGTLHRTSAIYETAAWGNEGLPSYLNQAVCVATRLEPLALLGEINAIEKRLGRIRTSKWESRLIDIDILYYAHTVVNEVNLQIPHRYLPDRRFALTPLHEIAAEFVHPVLGKTTRELLDETPDPLAVWPFNPDTNEQHEL